MIETSWRSPSNIAFVKYWGKKGPQIPANPSVSLTLKHCYTETTVTWREADVTQVELFLEGKSEPRFASKIRDYLLKLPIKEVQNLSCSIQTKNTFPHGTGIASSASGLSAFALNLTDYLYQKRGKPRDAEFLPLASDLSRQASGSACRSVYGGYTTWGEWSASGTSDQHASKLEVHSGVEHLHDTVLIISDAEKSVSSRAGHERMKVHGFAAARFVEAKKNFGLMIGALKSGDLESMGLVLENEALQLHAMMMTSPESFMLMRPNTLAAIELVRDFRRESKLPVYFTLDAGPNLHLIYPHEVLPKVSAFIQHELRPLTQQIIEDERGEGPECLR